MPVVNGTVIGRSWSYQGVWTHFFMPQLGFRLLVRIGWTLWFVFLFWFLRATDLAPQLARYVLPFFIIVMLVAAGVFPYLGVVCGSL